MSSIDIRNNTKLETGKAGEWCDYMQPGLHKLKLPTVDHTYGKLGLAHQRGLRHKSDCAQMSIRTTGIMTSMMTNLTWERGDVSEPRPMLVMGPDMGSFSLANGNPHYRHVAQMARSGLNPSASGQLAVNSEGSCSNQHG